MELEKIVLIFALFGSAKVVLDTIVAAVKYAASNQNKSDEADKLKEAVTLIESMSLEAEKLRDSNVMLQKRLDELQLSVAEMQVQPVKRNSRNPKKVAAPVQPENSEPASVQHRHGKSSTEEQSPFYMDSDRFEVVIV
ncbi:hypothetical protein [Diaphorobacter sp. J5-51]|uniref:hypothetical protein n=1 Tax=Diaphorobacter sp. J5-51 TaxID=680496 RepID=UPI0012F946E2|nr:hypothetical protein [Diaphorobacter sp. J5-51]